MSRAVKPAETIKAEGKSHRTKAELEARARAESAMMSGEPLTEDALTKADAQAHRKFTAVKKLLTKIGKNDKLYSDAVNQYCQLYSEIARAKLDEAHFRALAEKLEQRFDELEDADADTVIKFGRELKGYIKEITTLGAGIMQRRKMMTDIGKEFGLTAAAALRIIPKSPDKHEDDALIKALRGEEE